MIKAKYLVAAVVMAAAFSAQAAQVTGCTGSQTASVSGATPFGTSGTPRPTGTFVKVGFGVSCSAKVNLQYNEVAANTFLVASGSTKGNQTYKGNSAAGGSILPDAACSQTAGCTTEVGTALTNAAALASS